MNQFQVINLNNDWSSSLFSSNEFSIWLAIYVFGWAKEYTLSNKENNKLRKTVIGLLQNIFRYELEWDLSCT